MQDDSKRRFLLVTAGNIRQSHIYVRGHHDFFPPESVGPSRKSRNSTGSPVEIALDGLAEVIWTDLTSDSRTGKPRGFFRGRKWVRKFFQHHKIAAGDLLVLERLNTTNYRLSVERRVSSTVSKPPGHLARPSEKATVSSDDGYPPLAATWFSTHFSGPAWPDRFGKWISDWSKRDLNASIRTLSLFTGAGGLDIGFHQAGFHAVEMVELDERFVATLDANCGMFGMFSGAAPKLADVRQYIPNGMGKIDFIIGGPPCQSFSAAGRRAGGVQGTTDERGQLFLTYVDLLRRLKPRGFLFENVYGITGANGGRDWETIRAAFRDAGYNVFHRILDTADYGVPQHRERMFIVGLRQGDFYFPRPTHGPDSPSRLDYYTAGAAVDGAPRQQPADPVTVNGRYGQLLNEVPPGLNYSFFTERMHHPRPLFAWRSKFSDFLYKADPSQPVRTIKAQGGQYTGPFHWHNRPFSTSELKRLQTFPDDYDIVGGRASVIQQIGNSVPPQIARVLALAILEQVFGATLPMKMPLLNSADKLGFRTRKRERTAYYTNLARVEKTERVLADPARVNASIKRVVLSEDFRLLERGKQKDGIAIAFCPSDEAWCFRVGYVQAPPVTGRFAIKIFPRPGTPWPLPCSVVTLKGANAEAPVFTVAWKAFEAELLRQHLKADLVQLAGYYQYVSAFCAHMKVIGSVPWTWKALAEVVGGKGTRVTMPAAKIAAEWGIEVGKLREFAQFLRSLGMEIRNHNTNPQIPKGHWLLPYAFPSLNHQSVQLHKELGA